MTRPALSKKTTPTAISPKLKELEGVLDDECLSDGDVKVIIFSEWVGYA